MKKIYTFIMLAMFGMNIAVAQNGATCNTALHESSNNHCVYTNYVITGTEMWFWFKATSKYVNIQAITTSYGTDAPHVHGITLYSGTCANLVEIASDELAFISSAHRLAIDLDASGLVVGNIYYIKLTREAKGDVKCDKGDCFPVLSPAVFDICIEEIDVYIPVDMQAEAPVISHTYYQNRGQLLNTSGVPAMDVKMYTINANPAVFIGEGFVSFVHSKIDTVLATPDTMHRVDMKLVGMELPPRVFKTERVQGFVNHYLPHIPRGITETKGFSRAVNNDVYYNIDMQFYSNSKGMKFYFVVRPGGDADQIRMKFEGATNTGIVPTQFGDGLRIETTLGDIVFESAHVYRIHPTNNNLVPMPASGDFVDLGNNEYEFDIGNYPSSWALVIAVDRGHTLPSVVANPPTLGTYIGGGGSDIAYDIKTDAQDNYYVTGETQGLAFPLLGLSQKPFAGGLRDAFVGQFNTNYEQVWTTYFGGSDYDLGFALEWTPTAGGQLYMVGFTKSPGDFPAVVLTNAYNYNLGGFGSGFLARFNPSDGVVSWATKLADQFTYATDVEVDVNGNVYVVGYTSNWTAGDPLCAPPINNGGFPLCNTLPSCYYQNFYAGGATFFTDGFILRFDQNGKLEWGTYFGGDGDDFILAADVDRYGGWLQITGHTTSAFTGPPQCLPGVTNFPLCNNGGYFQNIVNGDGNTFFTEPFVAKFSLVDGQMARCTYFGGYRNDVGTDIISNPSNGDIYVTGHTGTNYAMGPNCGIPTLSGFPTCTTATSYTQSFNGTLGDSEAFIAKFDEFDVLKWSTYIGGRGHERVPWVIGDSPHYEPSPSLALGEEGNVYVTGTTSSPEVSLGAHIPLQSNVNFYYQGTNTDVSASVIDATDAYVLSFDPTDDLIYGTYFGGKGTEQGTSNPKISERATGIATFSNTKVYITGGTFSTSDFPLNQPNINAYFDDGTNGTVSNQKSDAYIAQLAIFPIGIEEESIIVVDPSFIIYPNPTDGKLIVELEMDEQEKAQITLLNLMGQVILENEIKGGRSSIDLSGFVNGVYVIQVQWNGNISSHKIVKQK